MKKIALKRALPCSIMMYHNLASNIWVGSGQIPVSSIIWHVSCSLSAHSSIVKHSLQSIVPPYGFGGYP